MGSFRVEPVTGALGAEVRGVDLTKPISDDTAKELRGALLEYLVLFFRDQLLTPSLLLEVGRRFGTLHIHPITRPMEGFPEIIEVIKEAEETNNWGDEWHTDLTALAAPPLGSILYGKEVPPFSGDTQFLNMYLAYDTLSPALRRFLDGLSCVHDQDVEAYGEARFKSMSNLKDATASSSVHPLVRTHPETGRKALFLSRLGRSRIDGFSKKESAALLGFLDQHASNPDLACRFRWKPNSVAFWDNRCTRHRVTADYFYAQRGFVPHRRHMYRVTVDGDVPR